MLAAVGLSAGFLQAATSLPAAAAGVYTVTNTNDSGPGSLRQAISEYNADTFGADFIIFSLPTPSTIYVGSTLDIDNTDGVPLTISGAGANRTIIDGQGLYEVFDVFGGYVTITGVTIQNGSNEGGRDGGGIYSEATVLNLTGVSVLDNSAASGGGIYNEGTLNVFESLISGNTAGGAVEVTVDTTDNDGFHGVGDGGGILNDWGTVNVTGSTITDNTAGGEAVLGVAAGTSNVLDEAGSGGGIYNYYGTVTLLGTAVNGNAASGGESGGANNADAPDSIGDGGGMYNCYGTLLVHGSEIDANTAVDGGGIYSNGGEVEVPGCPSDDSAPTILKIDNSEFSRNAASDFGGAIDVYDTTFSLAVSAIRHNSAGLKGGGIYYSGGTQAISTSVITSNTPNNIYP
jgi:hypothetical protein